MTKEQINEAIAKACGWTECRLVECRIVKKVVLEKVVWAVLKDPVAYGVPPNGTYEIACPNYSTDLNAMHEAEETLWRDIWNVYINQLAKVTQSEESTDRSFLCATARQRAEAFLLTLGKWSATAEDSSVDHLRDATKMIEEALEN
jgi:hypothetical protein